MRGERGFSLVELVMVSAVMAILLTVGAASVRSALLREETDGWARAVAYEIRGGQQAAITRRTTVTASFQNQAYTIAAGATVLRRDTLPSHMTFGGTLQTVSFNRRGVPSGSLTFTVSSASGRSYTIAVAAGTGRVTVSEP